jgi:RND superfamily putative drug exporter
VFGALSRLATRHPWYVLIGWIVASVLIIATAPKLSSTADQSEFLPSKYESIRAANLQTDAFPQQTSVGALLVFDRTDGGKLTASDTAEVEKVVGELDGKVGPVFSGVVAQPASSNKLVQLGVVGISKDKNPYDPDAIDAARDLRDDAHAAVRGSISRSASPVRRPRRSTPRTRRPRRRRSSG